MGARLRAKAGVSDRVTFEMASFSKAFPGKDYDLGVAFFDVCTTWATPSARRRTSANRWGPDGTWMIVEPFANDKLETT